MTNKNINLLTMQALNAEFVRATSKHSWDGYTLDDMGKALTGELIELGEAEARGDIHGPHGMRAELLQVAVVALRTYEALEHGEGAA